MTVIVAAVAAVAVVDVCFFKVLTAVVLAFWDFSARVLIFVVEPQPVQIRFLTMTAG